MITGEWVLRRKTTLAKLSAILPQYHVSGIRLDDDPVIDGRSNPLLAAQVAFGSLNQDVSEQKLNLLQLTSRAVIRL